MVKKPNNTFFRKFSKNESRDSPNRRNLRDFSQKQKPQKEEKRSFNKKIVIQKNNLKVIKIVLEVLPQMLNLLKNQIK